MNRENDRSNVHQSDSYILVLGDLYVGPKLYALINTMNSKMRLIYV